MSERRIRKNKYRRQKELKRHLLISVFVLCIAIILAFNIFSIQTNAKDASEVIEIKYYTSIVVTSGDTLWTIASEYMGGHYKSEAEYIEEVMHMNTLEDETIYAGQHLVIPYYSCKVLD